MSRTALAVPPSLSLPATDARPITALFTPPVLLVLGCLLLLLPFLSKPLHIDDPMYVWAAEHILQHPLDPYGFAVNWNTTLAPMVAEMKNPPLVCYYLAAAMSVLGKSEQALHLAMLLPAVGVVLGTYCLAKEFCGRPGLAAAATLLAPGFLVSASTVMCDVAMICAYVWAIHFWVRGLRGDGGGKMWMLIVASLLIAVSTLSKYFGVTLFPLLLLYGFLVKRRPGAWLLPLLLPVALLLAYHLVTQRLYGHGLLLDAVGYATQSRWGNRGKIFAALTAGLTFTGGCCISAVLLAAVSLRRRRMLLAPLGVAVLLVVALLALDPIYQYSVRDNAGGLRWGMLLQIGVWSAAGAGVLMIGAAEVWRRRDADAALLGCWIAGTFCFAVFVNWNVAARSIVPMTPAVAIIAARMWERRERRDETATSAPADSMDRPWLPYVALAPAGALALLLVAADASLARTARSAANEIADALGGDFSGQIVFCGHWGFHEYMRRGGAQPLDVRHTSLAPGDLYIVPDNNTRKIPIPEGTAKLVTTLSFQPLAGVTTMRPELCAGFYSNVWGPLPFAFGSVPPERYHVLAITRPVSMEPKPAK